MSGADGVRCNKWSSLFEEVVEFSIFSSGRVVLHGLIGDSGDPEVDFSKFLNGEFFSRTKFFFFGLGLFSEWI